MLAAAAAPTDPAITPAPLVGRSLAERPVLLVGVTADSYPYGYIGPDGTWTGFASELLDAVTRVMDLRIQRVGLSGAALHQRFRLGEFDLLQALSQTAEREKYTEFTVPYLTLQGAIFTRKNDGSIRKLEDLQGKKFAMTGSDTIATQFLRDRRIEVVVFPVVSTEEGLRRVDAGQCDAVYVSNLTAMALIEHAGLKNVANLGAPLPDHDIRHCFAVHRGDAQLLARLNEGLAILHRTGEFDRLYDKWFGRFDSPLISRQQVVSSAAIALAVALVLALLALQHQRKLRRRIAGQARELAGQQALLQTLYDNIPMAMCVLAADPAGYRVLSINRGAEAWFRRPAAGVAGQLLATLTPDPEWLENLAELLQDNLAAGTLVREERRLPQAGKRLIFTLVPMTPDTAGGARLCVLVEDITERRNLDEEIAQSRKLRAVGELVGGIAHEFNNLLTPIMMKVGEIQLRWAHDTRLVQETRPISDSVQRATELTRRLLTFGRKGENPLEEVRLGPLISNCFSLLRLTVERRIRWEQDVPADLPPIYFSSTNLNQIILNLVINARDTLLEKLAAQRGEWTPFIRVEVRLLPAGASGHADGTPSLHQVLGWQRLTVRDNGMGIPPEVRERIFEPFFTTKDVGKGTGLGLATVWHLVTEASGRVEVESVPGASTAFHVYLPMLPAPAAPALEVSTAPVIVARTGPIRIFLAEDDDLVATSMTMALKHSGHQVVRLADGASAWQHLLDHRTAYELLIFDVNMPGLDGIELAKRVRTLGGYAGPIIITSGRLGSDEIDELTESHVDVILNKPFTVEELLEAKRKALAGRARR